MDFLEEKPGCRLPCWNGLTPGLSTAWEVQAFFARLGLDAGHLTAPNSPDLGEEYISLEQDNDSNDITTYTHVKWEKNKVIWIEIELWDRPEHFSTSKMARVLGIPKEIKFHLSQGDWYSVLFHFPERQVAIVVHGVATLAYPSGEPLRTRVCLNDHRNQTANIQLYSIGRGEKIVEEYIDPYWVDWASLLGISVEELFTLLQKGNGCQRAP
jgi:hypothetical protein